VFLLIAPWQTFHLMFIQCFTGQTFSANIKLTIAFRSFTITSISDFVVERPMLRRMALEATSGGTPDARRTCEQLQIIKTTTNTHQCFFQNVPVCH